VKDKASWELEGRGTQQHAREENKSIIASRLQRGYRERGAEEGQERQKNVTWVPRTPISA